MTLVDSSVWIDLFADRDTVQVRRLRGMVAGREPILVGDLILAEVLQGARSERDATLMLIEMGRFEQLRIVNSASAILAAHHYRHLRAVGITVRKTIDTLIATRCIIDRIPLLFADRDFQPFFEHFGLRSALDASGVT